MGYLYGAGLRALRQAVEAGEISGTELQDQILLNWTRNDSPASPRDEAVWVWIFRTTGFFSRGAKSIRPQPSGMTTVYRGATTERVRHMSWSEDEDLAEMLGKRHKRYGATAIYRATIAPRAVLAYLFRPAEGWTVVVDPDGLPAEPEVVRWL